MSHYGTMAAELVTSEAAWEDVPKQAPGWSPEQNLQVVLRVNVIVHTPEKTGMTAAHVW